MQIQKKIVRSHYRFLPLFLIVEESNILVFWSEGFKKIEWYILLWQ